MSQESTDETPPLDEWRAEVGDDAVSTAVEAARAQIAERSLRGFSDKDELFAWVPKRAARTKALVAVGPSSASAPGRPERRVGKAGTRAASPTRG